MRVTLSFTLCCIAILALACLCIFTGSVHIPASEILSVIFGGEASRSTWTNIILELRIPMAVTAALTGAALGVAGLMLQTVFNNPLAGPSILGVSTGASLGVAVVLLALPGWLNPSVAAIAGAFAGATAVLLLLMGFSAFVRSGLMLLIVGIMIGYLTSAAISILNFFATQEGVHSYVIWGLGNFSGVGKTNLPTFSVVITTLLVASFLLVKPLNAMLLGERYASNIGINVSQSRLAILFVSGILIAVTTAYCGPIGFIGLAIPHIARLLTGTSNHKTLLPAVMITGALIGLLTLWISTLAGSRGTLPVNAITPLIGIPVVLYIIFNKRLRQG